MLIWAIRTNFAGMTLQKKINLGIFAHVDAGKTSISEKILYLSGAVRKEGKVDDGSSHSDTMSIERERGISVKTANISMLWKDTLINIIDTPGHPDFSPEAERGLRSIDMLIMVISAVEGLQSHTYSLWEAIRRRKLPVIFFINKTDRPGADVASCIKQIRNELNASVFPTYIHQNEDAGTEAAGNIWDHFPDEITREHEAALEGMADVDDAFMEYYLSTEHPDKEYILKKAQQFAANGSLSYLLSGSAKYETGITELMDTLISFADIYENDAAKSEPVSAFVFRTEASKQDGLLAHIRLFRGSIIVRDALPKNGSAEEVRINRIVQNFGGKLNDTHEIHSGDTAILSCGSRLQCGDILGKPDFIPVSEPLNIPLMTVEIKADDEKDYSKLAEALLQLNQEEPALNFTWLRDEREFHISILGKIQQEIVQERLASEFDIRVLFQPPQVIFKEKIASPSEAIVRYTMPKPCWAVMRFRLEPLADGAGIHYESRVSTDKIARKYQNEVESSIPEIVKQSIQGWELTDTKIILLDGEDHEMHSRPGDFILAAPMGIMRALKEAGTKLLEPIQEFEIRADEEYLGAIASDMNLMRATLEPPVFDGNRFLLKGKVPASECLDYGIRFQSVTKGKGSIRLRVHSYSICPEGKGQSRAFRGVNPLDTSQWILHQRGAFKADDRKM